MRPLAVSVLLVLFGFVACGRGGQKQPAGGTQGTAQEGAAPTPQAGTTARDTAPVIVAQIRPGPAATGKVSGMVYVYALTTGQAQPAETTTTGGTGAAGGGFRLTATVYGLTPGEHAWHIHSGTCDQNGPVKVAITSTAQQHGIGRSLDANRNGEAMGSVTVPGSDLTLAQLESGQYSLHIHQHGGVNPGPTVACADLTSSPM